MATSASLMSPAAQPLPDDLLLELLIRLPIKKVNQFRLVSKDWSLIISRPSLSEAYNARKCLTGILYFVQATDAGIVYFARAASGNIHRHKDDHKFYWSALRVLEPQELVSNFQFDGFSGIRCSQIVNGLVCFQSYGRVYIDNVVTGEKKRLLDLVENSMGTVKLHLGFDPVNRVYKLLRNLNSLGGFRSSSRFPRFKLDVNWYNSTHILIIGDSSWTELPYSTSELSCLHPTSPSILVDGVLYSSGMDKYNAEYPTLEDTIVAFDLIEENFRLVHPPLPLLKL